MSLASNNRTRVVQPQGWPEPKGYVNGIVARGELVFLAGMVGCNRQQQFAADFVLQAKQALQNIIEVLHSAGAGPEHVVRMTWYVVNMDQYLQSQKALGLAYREVMKNRYPAMTLVEVSRLVEPHALLEIEATAVVPNS